MSDRLIVENAYGQALLVVHLHPATGHDAAMIHYETEGGDVYRMRIGNTPVPTVDPNTLGLQVVQANPSPTPPPAADPRPALPQRTRPQDWRCPNPECLAMNAHDYDKCTWCTADRPGPAK